MPVSHRDHPKPKYDYAIELRHSRASIFGGTDVSLRHAGGVSRLKLQRRIAILLESRKNTRLVSARLVRIRRR